MESEWFAHLPGLELNEFEEALIGVGRLVQLPRVFTRPKSQCFPIPAWGRILKKVL